MNKYIKFLWLIIGIIFCSFIIFKEKTFRVGGFIFLIGILSNGLVVSLNELKMPTYDKKAKKIYQQGIHFITSNKDKIKLYHLSNIIPIPKTKYSCSIGDLLMVTGFIIFLINKYIL